MKRLLRLPGLGFSWLLVGILSLILKFDDNAIPRHNSDEMSCEDCRYGRCNQKDVVL